MRTKWEGKSENKEELEVREGGREGNGETKEMAKRKRELEG